MIPTIPAYPDIAPRREAFNVAKAQLLESLPTLSVLDAGYVKVVDFWGSDEAIIEAARMSTNKGFNGWGPLHDSECWVYKGQPCACSPSGNGKPGDEKLLRYLWENRHATPFEMAGMVVEVKLPLFVVREWHRHRTQFYNEMSARYVPLPDENYCPTIERIVRGAQATSNKQAQGTQPLQEMLVVSWLEELQRSYRIAQETYEYGLKIGVPKELARLSVPVARYTRMRAGANLRNILGFMSLRYHPKAQWEIQEYAKAWCSLLDVFFTRTVGLWVEGAELP